MKAHQKFHIFSERTRKYDRYRTQRLCGLSSSVLYTMAQCSPRGSDVGKYRGWTMMSKIVRDKLSINEDKRTTVLSALRCFPACTPIVFDKNSHRSASSQLVTAVQPSAEKEADDIRSLTLVADTYHKVKNSAYFTSEVSITHHIQFLCFLFLPFDR